MHGNIYVSQDLEGIGYDQVYGPYMDSTIIYNTIYGSTSVVHIVSGETNL